MSVPSDEAHSAETPKGAGALRTPARQPEGTPPARSVAELKLEAQLKHNNKQTTKGTAKSPVNGVSEVKGPIVRPVMAVSEQSEGEARGLLPPDAISGVRARDPELLLPGSTGGTRVPEVIKQKFVSTTRDMQDFKDSAIDIDNLNEYNLIQNSEYIKNNSKSEWDIILDDLDGDDLDYAADDDVGSALPIKPPIS